MNDSLIVLSLLVIIFIPLERFMSLRIDQIIFRHGWLTDLLHYFSNTFLLQIGISSIIATFYFPLSPFVPISWKATVSGLPIIIQLFLIIVLAEVGYYTAHRLAHNVPILWRFHQIHHSSKEMDWLSTARFHPVDLIIIWSITLLPIVLLGFSPKSFIIFQTIWLFQNYLAHSNIKWPFSILNKFFVTPQIHHWHHSSDPKIYNHNFAGQLTFMDHLWGTYYNAQEKKPEFYGVDNHNSAHFFKHLLKPFYLTIKEIWQSRIRKSN